MKTDVVKPQGIFFNPNRLVVPLFQRPYVWSRETQWEPLWEDIVRLIEVIENHNPDATHFLGAIVTQQVQTGLGALPAANVIDGQQRLTTLQLLLDALHSELERRGYSTLASQVQHLIENPSDSRESDEDHYKLWPTNRDRAGFAAVMSAPTPVDYDSVPASRLRDAHRFFAESITAWLGDDEGEAVRRARMLVPAIKDRLEIASISLDSDEDAQAIFETLNARGTPLSAADLIKNFIFQQVPAKDAERLYLANWSEFETPWWETVVTSGRIKNPRASLFLWQWLVAQTLSDFPIREVFTQFKHYVNTVEKDVTRLLTRIKAAADRYRAIIEAAERPNGPLSRIELFSYRIGTLDTDVARPLLIWLDDPQQAGIPSADRDRIIAVLESWFVRRALIKAPSQGSNRFIIDLLQHLSRQPSDSVADAAERFLIDNHTPVGFWPGDAEVRSALRTANVYGGYRRARVRMVLEALEDAKRGYPSERPLAMGPITRGKGTIEHLMPQAWREHWLYELTEGEAAKRDEAVQQLGNLTIVTQSLNSTVSNSAWAAKRAHFDTKDDVLLTRDVVRSSADGVWGEERIAARTNALIDQILVVWPAPAGHVGLVAAAPVITRASVDVAELVDAGWLDAGARLVSRSPSYPDAEATIAQDGRVYLGGTPYDTPSGAAVAAMSGKGTMNGWWFWGLEGTDRRLSDVRDDYLASLGEADAEVEADVDASAVVVSESSSPAVERAKRDETP